MDPGQSGRQWVPVGTVAAGLAVAAVVPTGDGVARPGPLGLVTLDLWLHAFGYGLLAVAVLFALGGESLTHRSALAAVGGPSGYGLVLEGVQSALPYRSLSAVDAAVNTAGAAIALCLVWLWQSQR